MESLGVGVDGGHDSVRGQDASVPIRRPAARVRRVTNGTAA
jgi:hypothetical protein